MSDAEQNQVRITLGWNEEIGEITVEEDSAQLPKRIEHYLFHQEDDVLILSTEDQDDIDTCYIRHISNDSIVIIHNNPDVFFYQGLATKRFYTEETEVSRKTTEYGTTINKVIKIGKKGEIQTSFFYQGGDLSKTPKVITIIPNVYKVK